jgi:hypothetical protein
LTPIPRCRAAPLPRSNLDQLKTSQTLDNLDIRHNPPSPLRSSRNTSKQTLDSQRIPIPKALSPRAVPLFIFLHNDTLPQRFAVEGIVEWIEHWVQRGIRVRVLAEELDAVKEEVSHRAE